MTRLGFWKRFAVGLLVLTGALAVVAVILVTTESGRIALFRMAARIVSVADAFDAMTSERPYRHSLSVGEVATEMARLAPTKFDPNVVQGLLVQLRRDATGRNKPAFLDDRVECNISPVDIDQIAASLNYRINKGRVYSA